MSKVETLRKLAEESTEAHRRRLRDEFAMAALTGLMAFKGADLLENNAATFCYGMADAMLKAREQT